MKNPCISFLFLLLCTTLSAQSQDNSLSASSVTNVLDNGLRWDHTTHDFGEIAQGTPQTAEFVLTNSGDDVLIITNVKSSCGCTTAKHTQEPIQPGEGTIISTTYNAKNNGSFRKTVTVSTSRSDTPIVLSLIGTVISQE